MNAKTVHERKILIANDLDVVCRYCVHRLHDSKRDSMSISLEGMDAQLTQSQLRMTASFLLRCIVAFVEQTNALQRLRLGNQHRGDLAYYYYYSLPVLGPPGSTCPYGHSQSPAHLDQSNWRGNHWCWGKERRKDSELAAMGATVYAYGLYLEAVEAAMLEVVVQASVLV